MALQVGIDDKGVRALIGGTIDLVEHPPKDFWLSIQGIARLGADSVFKKLDKGGTHRGIRWADFRSPAARRGIDPSPAGRSGRNRLVTRGERKGERYRRSVDSLMSSSDNLLQDDGLLARRTGAEFKLGANRRSVEIGTNLPYAEAQFARRPALFWAKADIVTANRAADKFLITMLKRQPGVR